MTSLSFRIAMREHGKLRFNLVPYLLALAFADGAFFYLNSPEELERWNPEEPTRLLWKSDMEEKPILRMVTRSSGVSERPLIRQTFCYLFRAIVCNAGYYKIITIYSLRRGLANRIDSKNRLTHCKRMVLMLNRSGNGSRKGTDPKLAGSKRVWSQLH